MAPPSSDLEGGPHAANPVKPAMKPSKPPSPLVPRLAALAAMSVLLAIPVIIPLVVMKVTGTNGKSYYLLENSIVAPPSIVPVLPEETTPEEVVESFLKIGRNATFERFCRPYYTSGFNAYELVETAMVDGKSYLTVDAKSGAAIVEGIFAEAAAMGINTVRTWAHTTTAVYPFQLKPGVYSPIGLASLDFVLETARKYGLQVILSFIDNWKYHNGVDQYLDWSTTAPARGPNQQFKLMDQNGDPTPQDYSTAKEKEFEVERHALFFSDPDANKFYMNHVAFMINRTNTINGRKYRDDPTILAWNLMNEPRCETWLAANADCNTRVQNWLEKMAKFVRQNDPNHLITVGSEGFFGPSTPQLAAQYNPQDWASTMGQDFVENTNIPEIDYATVHAWPDNWELSVAQTPSFLDAWVTQHIASAGRDLTKKKPVMFEEFGKRLELNQQSNANIANLRDPIYNSTFASVQRAINANQAIAGALFWKWAIPVFQGQSARGLYGVLPTDSTMNIVENHSAYMRLKLNSVPPRPECGLGAWVGNLSGNTRTCVNVPQLSEAYYGLAGGSKSRTQLAASGVPETTLQVAEGLIAKLALVFPTKAACCKAGNGAFVDGCTVVTR